MSVEQTTDYEVFKSHICNRDLDQSNLKKLESSIKERNLLPMQPILVDREFNVIDGNHRLEIAKRLGIPIFYQVEETCNARDIILLNNNKKFWSVSDYLKFYAQKEYVDYVKLNDFITKEKMQLNIALQLINGSRSTHFFNKFKEGQYEFPDEQEFAEVLNKNKQIKETIEFIKKKTSGSKTYLDRVTFYGALVDFFNIKSFVYEVFRKKLEMRIDLVRHCTRQCDYVKLFKDIYNYKNQTPLVDHSDIGFQT